jgi:hypothetical protein
VLRFWTGGTGPPSIPAVLSRVLTWRLFLGPPGLFPLACGCCCCSRSGREDEDEADGGFFLLKGCISRGGRLEIIFFPGRILAIVVPALREEL